MVFWPVVFATPVVHVMSKTAATMTKKTTATTTTSFFVIVKIC